MTPSCGPAEDHGPRPPIASFGRNTSPSQLINCPQSGAAEERVSVDKGRDLDWIFPIRHERGVNQDNTMVLDRRRGTLAQHAGRLLCVCRNAGWRDCDAPWAARARPFGGGI